MPLSTVKSYQNSFMNILVVAKKYNDIYYALSLPEWNMSKYKTLIIITKKLSLSNYPMQDLFDEVHCIQSRTGSIGIFQTLIDLKCLLPKLSYDTVVLSNISLVSNKYIVNNEKCKQAILIEDGYMNYYDFQEPKSIAKSSIMSLFGIRQSTVLSKIYKSYLLEPQMAKYFFGVRCKLKIASDVFCSRINTMPDLQGRKLFIGQPLYHSYTGNDITIEQYNEIINKIIKMFDIDYYVPHTMADDRESIECKLFDIGAYKCTFEVLASIYDLEIYAISSSVLYTTKVINPKCKSFIVQIPNVKRISPNSILFRYADEMLEIN